MLSYVNKTKLLQVVESIYPRLHWLKSPYGRHPSKPGDGGDDCLWLGLLSSVAFNPAIESLAACQAKTDEPRPGMFYRNPLRRSNDNDGHPAFFSRDMACGVLLYYASGRGTYGSALAWQKYWESQRYCITKKPWPFKGCMISGYKFAPDDRSDITPKVFAMLRRVWCYREWPTTTEMNKWKNTDGDYDVIESKLCDNGYQLHLHCVDAYIKRIINQSSEYADRVSGICLDRCPTNLFYLVVARNESMDCDVDRFLKLYELSPKGEFGKDWLWEKDNIDSYVASCCGWDLYFMAKLLLKLG